MDEVRPVKTKGSTTDQPRVPKDKSLPRAKFVEPLTPLHRLARFKEIRDRNLARGRNLRKSVQIKRNSLAPPFIMDSVVNGVGRTEAKLKSSGTLSNGNTDPSHNGVEHPTNGNGLSAEPALEQFEVVTAGNVIKNGEKSPKTNSEKEERTDEVKENVGDSGANEPVQEGAIIEPVETGNGNDVEDVSESEDGDGHESEGSSLDVVGESSSDSLDLQVSHRSSEEASEKDLGSSHSPESAPPLQPDQPKVVTPEIVRRIRAGGRIAARRTLRGEHTSPALKRKLDDDDESPSGKKPRDDGTTSSPGWQFFSPSKSFSKFWTPFRSTPKTAEFAHEADESMFVNVDDQSNIFEKIIEETATTLIEESQEKPAPRWCAIM